VRPARKAPPLAPAWGPTEIVEDVEQGSDEWFALRLGIPTASNFAMVVRDGDSRTRDGYMRVLAGERLTGAPSEGKRIGGSRIVTAAMQRGNDMEPEAREHYARTNFGAGIERVGFMRRKLPSGRYVGASPDALLAKRRGALEIKTMQPDLMIERLVKGAAMPPDHRWQVYGTMLVGSLDFVELMLFYRGMPVAPKFKLGRDEAVIKEISDAVEVFDHELDRLVERVRAMGAR
jgi:hypothetical protein